MVLTFWNTLYFYIFKDISTIAPRLENIFKILDGWVIQLVEELDNYPGGCPEWFLRNMDVNNKTVTSGVQTASLLCKYRTLIEPNNTPFEYEAKGINRVKRLWNYLIKQEHLSAYFIKYIFGKKNKTAVNFFKFIKIF